MQSVIRRQPDTRMNTLQEQETTDINTEKGHPIYYSDMSITIWVHSLEVMVLGRVCNILTLYSPNEP